MVPCTAWAARNQGVKEHMHYIWFVDAHARAVSEQAQLSKAVSTLPQCYPGRPGPRCHFHRSQGNECTISSLTSSVTRQQQVRFYHQLHVRQCSAECRLCTLLQLCSSHAGCTEADARSGRHYCCRRRRGDAKQRARCGKASSLNSAAG